MARKEKDAYAGVLKYSLQASPFALRSFFFSYLTNPQAEPGTVPLLASGARVRAAVGESSPLLGTQASVISPPWSFGIWETASRRACDVRFHLPAQFTKLYDTSNDVYRVLNWVFFFLRPHENRFWKGESWTVRSSSLILYLQSRKLSLGQCIFTVRSPDLHHRYLGTC